jgi:hypothetical protein
MKKKQTASIKTGIFKQITAAMFNEGTRATP